MKWNEKLVLGIEKIDEQHKKLIELASQAKELLLDCEDGVDCYDEIVEVLEELASYTVSHFSYEEIQMEKVGYKNLAAHKVEHQIFIKKVSNFMSSDLDEDQLDKLEEIVIFLLDWVSQHILSTDSQYVGVMKIS